MGHSSQGLRRPYGATKTISPIKNKNTGMSFNDRKLDPNSKAQEAYTSSIPTQNDLHQQDLMSTASRFSSRLQETLEIGKKLNQSNAKGIGAYPNESRKMARVKFGPVPAVSTTSVSSRQHFGSFDKFEDHRKEKDGRKQAQELLYLSTAKRQSTNPFDSSDSEDEEDLGMRYRPPSTSHVTVDSSVAPSGDRYLPEKEVPTPTSHFPRVNKAVKANMNEKLTESGLQVSTTGNQDDDDPNRPLHSMLNRGELKFDFETEISDGDVPHSTTSLELNPLDPGLKSVKGRDRYTCSKTKPVRRPEKTSLNGFEQDISSQVLLGSSNNRPVQSSRPPLSAPSQSEIVLEETDAKDANSFSISILDNVENCIELVCGDVTHHSPLTCIKTEAHKHSMKQAPATTKNEGGHTGFAFGEDAKGALGPKGGRYRKAMGKMLSPKKKTTERDTVTRSEDTSFNFKSFETDVHSFSISGSWDNQEEEKEEDAADLGKLSGATLLSTLRVEEEVIKRNRILLDSVVGANHASYRVLTTENLLGVDSFGRMVQGNSIPDCYPKGTILRKATMRSPMVRCLGKGMATITYLRIDEVRNGVETESRKLMETRMWKKEKQVWVNCHFQQTAVLSN
mmetsp:Transcript_268/g.380  ORF Transcript_268/g.380 Transcript_268/m.380 type:complete len:621 (+) Transcript_268:51-1913(+)